VALALVLSLSGPGGAAAASGSISPTSQSHSHGVYSQWDLTWGGPAPLDVRFDADYYNVLQNHIWYWLNVNPGSDHVQWRWFPCTDTTFTQRLRVVDNNSAVAVKWSTALERGGVPC
jgi:hypothetical protein